MLDQMNNFDGKTESIGKNAVLKNELAKSGLKSGTKITLLVLVVLGIGLLTVTNDIQPFSLFAFPENIIFINSDTYTPSIYDVRDGKVIRHEFDPVAGIGRLGPQPGLSLYDVKSDTIKPISWTEVQNFTVADARGRVPSPSGYELKTGVTTLLECGPFGIGCITNGPSHTDLAKGILRIRLSWLGSVINSEYIVPLAWVVSPSRSQQKQATELFQQRISQDMVWKETRKLPERYTSWLNPKVVTIRTLEEARLHDLPLVDYLRLFDLGVLKMLLNRNKPVAQLAALKNQWGGGSTEETLDPITGKEYEYRLYYDEQKKAFNYELCATLDSQARHCTTKY